MIEQKFGLNKVALIVDDEKILRETIQYDFEKKGFKVFTAANGNEAIDIIKEHHIDLIISDMQMPLCDGICLIKKIKIMQSFSPIFLFMSGFSIYTQSEIESMGALTILSKPLNRKEMFRIVETAMNS